jgi:hypothetical protein
VDRPSAGATELVGIAIPSRRQGLKFPERSRLSLEEQTAGARNGHLQQGTGPADVDQVQSIGSKPRRHCQIESIEVGRPGALHSQIDIALRSRPIAGNRTEQNKKPKIRHHAREIGQTLSDELGGDGGGHVATVWERCEGGQDTPTTFWTPIAAGWAPAEQRVDLLQLWLG